MKKLFVFLILTIVLILLFPFTAFSEDGTWEVIGDAGFSTSAANYPSFYSSNAVPYVAYADTAKSRKITVKKYENDSWQTLGVEGFSSASVKNISLFVYGDTPYVAYTTKVGGNRNAATVKKYVNGSWEQVGSEVVSEWGAQYLSLYVDDGEVPYLAYKDTINSSKLTVQKYTDSGWVLVGEKAFTDGEANVVKLFVHDGTPYVGYQDGTNDRKATVMKYDNSNGWIVVGTEAFSDGAIHYASLYVVDEDTVYFSYLDTKNGSGATLKKYDGTSWETVGTDAFSAGRASYTSLQVYNGVPYVAYTDSGNGDKATVMKYINGNWENVGVAGFSNVQVNYTSLFIENGIVYVGFRDFGNGYGPTVMKFTPNNPPNRKTSVPETKTKEIEANSEYTLDLFTIFEDADNDILTFQVQVKGGAFEDVTSDFSFTPTAEGQTVFVFKAFDQYGESNTYTLTINAVNTNYEVTYNANGGINAPANANYSSGSVVYVADQGSMTNNDEIFLGWNTSQSDADNGIVQYSSKSSNVNELYFLMPSNDIILYAVWRTPSPEPIIFEVIGIAKGEIIRDYNYMMIDDPLSLGGSGLYAEIQDILENQRCMLETAKFSIDDNGSTINQTTILNASGFYANNGNTIQLNPDDVYEEINGFDVRRYSSNPIGFEVNYLQNIPYAGFTVNDFEMNKTRTITQINSAQVFSPVLPSINIEVIGIVEKSGAGWFNQLDVTVDDPNYYVLKYNYGPDNQADEVPNFFEIRRVSDNRVEALYNGNHSTFTFYNYETTYTVTYEDGVADENIAVPTDNTDYSNGETVMVSSVEPIKSEGTFMGWKSSEDNQIYKTDGDNDFIMPAADVILTAQWGYDVVYAAPDATGGTIPRTNNNEISGNVYTISTQEPTKTGYTFVGWKSDIDGDTATYKTGTSDIGFTMPAADVTLTAQWSSLPLANEDTAVTIINTPVVVNVLENDTDPENDVLTIINSGTATQGGTVVIENGMITYTPATDFFGRDKFTYTIADPSGGESTATVIVTVQSATPDDPNARVIKVEGDIFYVTDETPIPDIEVTLYSTPKSGFTNSDGYFNLGYTSEGNHMIVAEWSPGEEIGRIPVTFTYGIHETYTLNADGSLDVTYNNDTEYIFLRLQIPRSTSNFEVRPINGVIFKHRWDTKAINPKTGDNTNWFTDMKCIFNNFYKNIQSKIKMILGYIGN